MIKRRILTARLIVLSAAGLMTLTAATASTATGMPGHTAAWNITAAAPRVNSIWN